MATAAATQVLSAQEQAILDGKSSVHGTVTDRVLRIFETVRAYGSPRVALERAVYFTESFKTTEGQPLVLRWAKALKNIAEKISVAIFDDELIVGRANTWHGRYSLVYPELDGSIMKAGAEAFIAAKGAPDAIAVQSIARATCHTSKEHREDLINMKMAPANVAGEEGTRRRMQLLRVWCTQKHAHIQFNILNKQTLLDAQKNPEKYRDLVVRIAGYCAYFVDLTPAQQMEIIARTEEGI